MARTGRRGGLRLAGEDGHLDLVPLIDCVFLLLLFFMICGRLSTDARGQQITVPPTRTAVALRPEGGAWSREIINVAGQGGAERASIRLGTRELAPADGDRRGAYLALRAVLDRIYDRAEKYDDPRGSGLKLPKVIVEIRADADAEYRVVQELQQILTGGFDIERMQPRSGHQPADGKPFVNLDFTTRLPGDRV